MVGGGKRRNKDITEDLEQLRETILKEFKELLALAMQHNLPVNSKLQQVVEELKDSSEPLFIPTAGKIDQEITVDESEESNSSLGDAAEALRRAKEKKEND